MHKICCTGHLLVKHNLPMLYKCWLHKFPRYLLRVLFLTFHLDLLKINCLYFKVRSRISDCCIRVLQPCKCRISSHTQKIISNKFSMKLRVYMHLWQSCGNEIAVSFTQQIIASHSSPAHAIIKLWAFLIRGTPWYFNWFSFLHYAIDNSCKLQLTAI